MPKLDNREYPLIQNFIDCAPNAAAIVKLHLEKDPEDFPPIEFIYDKKKGHYVVKTRDLPDGMAKLVRDAAERFITIHGVSEKFALLADVALWMPVPKLKRGRKKK